MRLAIIGIILAIVISGCTSDGGGTTSAGGSVVIKSFSADETSLRGNDKATLSAEIVNSGDSRATAVRIQLLELDLACIAPTCDSTTTQWGLQNGKVSDTVSDLRVSQTGEEAIPKQYNWRVQAPMLPANLEQDYQAIARVSFAYSTTTLKQIKLVTYEEYQRLKDRGETLQVTTAQPSNGPLGIDVRVNEPIRIEDASETFMLVIEVTNLAGGNTFLGTDPNAVLQWNWANLKLTLPTGLSMSDSGDCTSIITTAGLNVELSKGSNYRIACEVSAAAPAVSTDKTVIVRADYGYFVDSKLSAPMKITGRTTYTTIPPGSTPVPPGSTPPTTPGSVTDQEAPAQATGLQVSAALRDPINAGKFLTTFSFFEPSDNVGVTSFEIALVESPIVPTSDNWVSLTKITAPATQGPGSQITVASISLNQLTTYRIAIRAKDAAGNMGTPTFIEVQSGQY